MAEPNQKQIKKIVVKPDDELTDIVRKIDSAKEDNIVLTFSEPSDLLVSPVNLQVIQETADVAGKPLIFQIYENVAGSRNASEIGAVHTDDTGKIDDDMWNMAFADMQNRNKKVNEALKGVAVAPGVAAVASAATNDIDEDLPLGDEGGIDPEQVGDPQKETPEVVDNASSPESEEKSEFQERIDSAIEKSKQDLVSTDKTTVEEGGLLIAMDHDIQQDISKGAAIGVTTAAKKEGSPDLTGRDFKAATDPKPTTTFTEEQVDEKVEEAALLTTTFAKTKSILPKSIPSKLKNKKFIFFVFLPVVLIFATVLFLIYQYTPLVNITMYIESRPIRAEKYFTGDPTVEEFALGPGQLLVKKEVVSKERSDSTNATGTDTKGTKASGLVRFVCGPINGEVGVPKTIPAGTTLTADDGLAFVLVSDVSFTCPSTKFPTGTAEAADFGGEYNISSGVLMSVAGEPDVAATSETSFTGGTKEEFTVISQEDYNRVVNPLKETSFQEAENELKDLELDGWAIVPGSVKSELDGNVESDNPVGAEADVLNVTVKTKSSALYYKKDDIDNSVEELLLQAANDNNLFETDKDLELSLGDDYTSEVTVAKIEGEKVTMRLVANGEVKPTVDKDGIVNDLKGVGWGDGLKYLSDLTFVAKETEVKFEPDYFIKSLRYFPSKQGRILITVKDVEVELPVEEPPAE